MFTLEFLSPPILAHSTVTSMPITTFLYPSWNYKPHEQCKHISFHGYYMYPRVHFCHPAFRRPASRGPWNAGGIPTFLLHTSIIFFCAASLVSYHHPHSARFSHVFLNTNIYYDADIYAYKSVTEHESRCRADDCTSLSAGKTDALLFRRITPRSDVLISLHH